MALIDKAARTRTLADALAAPAWEPELVGFLAGMLQLPLGLGERFSFHSLMISLRAGANHAVLGKSLGCSSCYVTLVAQAVPGERASARARLVTRQMVPAAQKMWSRSSCCSR